jgi:hypothetical protein
MIDNIDVAVGITDKQSTHINLSHHSMSLAHHLTHQEMNHLHALVRPLALNFR